MAEQFVALGLKALPPMVDNYDKAWKPIKNNAKKFPNPAKSSKSSKEYSYDDMTPEQRGWVLKPRREVGSDEEIVQYVGRKHEVKGNELVRRRPPGQMVRRASSVDRGVKDYRWSKSGRRHYDSSDDEVDTRSRRGRNRAGSKVSTRSRRRRSSSSSVSSSDSSIISSSEEERQCKNMRRKKWLTAGLATVATIHAAQKVYTSLEARDKRTIEVARGEISPEEARTKRNAARWQDAAAVGIAALGIKGAYGEWHEMAEQREEYKKNELEREERHQKRIERAERAKELGVDYKAMLHPHKNGISRSRSERRGGGDGYDRGR